VGRHPLGRPWPSLVVRGSEVGKWFHPCATEPEGPPPSPWKGSAATKQLFELSGHQPVIVRGIRGQENPERGRICPPLERSPLRSSTERGDPTSTANYDSKVNEQLNVNRSTSSLWPMAPGGGSNRDRTAVRIGRPPPPSRHQLVPYVDENPPSKPSFSPASRFCWLRASHARNDVPGVHPVRVDRDGNN